ncbi:MAG TPA: TetR/AcrR family transcriptional regulator [Bacteroidales bacterium]|jgi:Transcriptional regulator|nr:TetR/AcrR family transcriptional regulator [Bacteroidales bacterium]
MKDTKEFILKSAYDLFLHNNYEAVTINKISEATKLTKGAIYHHYANKEDIFKAVVDKYMIENKVKIPYEHTSLDDFIQHTINDAQKKISEELAQNIGFQKVMPLHFISLTIDALQYYPGFAEIGQKFYENFINKWKSVLDDAVKNGEIRNDIDTEIISMNFLNISTGIIGNMIMRGSIDYAFEMFKKQMKELYKIIKL